MFKVGKALGAISNITFSSSGFFNKNLEIKKNITREGLINFCLESLEDATVKAIVKQEQRNQIKNIFKLYKNLLPDGTEKNLVHADFDPSNILVIENNGEIEISGILDWEFAFSGSTLCDIANMLRYAHQMPDDYQDSFLSGLLSTGYQLPNFWRITVNLLNILSLLDCLKHSDSGNRPNQIQDIQELIDHILCNLRNVEVLPYDPNWPFLFQCEANKIKTILANNFIDIYHIGSTAVPGLNAKQDIDILCIVDNLPKALKLQEIGYKFKGEFNIPMRYFFSKNTTELKVNLHIVERDHSFIDLQLAFRDYLRNNASPRKEYSQLKYDILQNPNSMVRDPENFNMPNYTLKKNLFIKNILRLANFDKPIINLCLFEDEWIAAKKLREYYFKKCGKTDVYDFTFDHENHRHLIFYQGVDIVGYAHVDLSHSTESAIKVIVIDEKYRGEQYHKKFTSLIGKWLKL